MNLTLKDYMTDAVCPDCIPHEALSDFVREEATSRVCSYCDARAEGSIALPVDKLIKRIRAALEHEWSPREDVRLPHGYEGDEFPYNTYDTYDLLARHGLDYLPPDLVLKIIHRIPIDEWVDRDPLQYPEERKLHHAWRVFSDLVRHKHRYLFFSDDQQDYRRMHRTPPDLPPGQILDRVGEMIRDFGLMTTIDKGETIYRVRIHDPDKEYSDIEELCSPPQSAAIHSNRMSPAGISTFYGSFDSETAIAETDQDDKSPAVATIGKFHVAEKIPVLDFTRLPDIPSQFANEKLRSQRPALKFLNEFVDALTEPVPKDKEEHIEYVPSQIVTEYLRYRFKSREDVRPEGIIYPSAVDTDGTSTVLFYTHWQFVGHRPVIGPPDRPPLQFEGTNREVLRTQNNQHRYRFVYRSAWEDAPDTPSVDTLWAESYQKALEKAYGTTDVLVVAVHPVEEEERLREALA